MALVSFSAGVKSLLEVTPFVVINDTYTYLQLHDSVLHVVAQNCVNLTWLDVAGVTSTDDSLCFTIAANCKKLTGINLKAAPLVSMMSSFGVTV